MSDQKIYPLLKAPDWIGKEQAINRPVVPAQEEDLPHVALLSYGYDDPVAFRFINKTNDLAMEQKEIEAEAFKNLRELQVSIEEFSFQELYVLTVSGNFFASEKALDADFMRSLQERLNTDMLAVSFPKRGTLMVTNGLAEEGMGRFIQLTYMSFLDEKTKNAPISALVYLVKDGEMVGYIQTQNIVSEDDKRAIVNGLNQNEEPKEEVFMKILASVDESTGKEKILVVCGGSDLYSLEHGIRYAIMELMNNLRSKESFSGCFEVMILPNITPDTPDLHGLMAKLTEDYKNSDLLNMLRPENGRSIEVNFHYGSQDDAGQGHSDQ